MGQEPENLGSFNGDIICEPPNNHLNKFEGILSWKGNRYLLLISSNRKRHILTVLGNSFFFRLLPIRYPLDNDKVLLRGCILRNTQWCYGVVLFAGRDTKLMQNSGKTKFKRTSIDRLLNFIILGVSWKFIQSKIITVFLRRKCYFKSRNATSVPPKSRLLILLFSLMPFSHSPE